MPERRELLRGMGETRESITAGKGKGEVSSDGELPSLIIQLSRRAGELHREEKKIQWACLMSLVYNQAGDPASADGGVLDWSTGQFVDG